MLLLHVTRGQLTTAHHKGLGLKTIISRQVTRTKQNPFLIHRRRELKLLKVWAPFFGASTSHSRKLTPASASSINLSNSSCPLFGASVVDLTLLQLHAHHVWGLYLNQILRKGVGPPRVEFDMEISIHPPPLLLLQPWGTNQLFQVWSLATEWEL